MALTVQLPSGLTLQDGAGGKTIQLPDGLTYREQSGGTALLQGVTRGTILLSGKSPRDSRYRQFIQGITSGTIQFVGLSPDNVYRVPVAYIEGVAYGVIDFSGLSPLELPTGKQQYKSAASKLGLGKYSDVDIWSTPFAGYIASFDRKQQYADKGKDQLEEIVRQYLAEIDLLQLQLQEMQSYSAGQQTQLLKTERRQALKREKELQSELRKIKSRILQQEDEELLILLFS